MATGYYPLNHEDGKKLLQVVEVIEKVRSETRDASSMDCTPEDAFSDGGYSEKLSMAISLIRECVDNKLQAERHT